MNNYYFFLKIREDFECFSQMLQEIAFLVSKQILNKKHKNKKMIGVHLIRPCFLFLYTSEIE